MQTRQAKIMCCGLLHDAGNDLSTIKRWGRLRCDRVNVEKMLPAKTLSIARLVHGVEAHLTKLSVKDGSYGS
jgi:hypothetical protein